MGGSKSNTKLLFYILVRVFVRGALVSCFITDSEKHLELDHIAKYPLELKQLIRANTDALNKKIQP